MQPCPGRRPEHALWQISATQSDRLKSTGILVERLVGATKNGGGLAICATELAGEIGFGAHARGLHAVPISPFSSAGERINLFVGTFRALGKCFIANTSRPCFLAPSPEPLTHKQVTKTHVPMGTRQALQVQHLQEQAQS